MSFLTEYLKAPRTIGAVAPSSRSLAAQMMKPVRFDKAEVIVEFGPGTGAFTRELVVRRRPDTLLILIEQNENFVRELKRLLRNQPNIRIIHGHAENVNEYLAESGFKNADYIVSGLPFTSLPKDASDRILTAAQTAVGEKGRFITFQYSMVKRGLFMSYFDICGHLIEMKNLPPAHVLVMKNKKQGSI